MTRLTSVLIVAACAAVASGGPPSAGAAKVDVTPARGTPMAGYYSTRLAEGVNADRFAARTGVALADALDPGVLRPALDEGYLSWRAGCLAATPAGRLRLDALLAALLR